MSSLEEFLANLESLPNTLQRKYSTIRDLDKSLEDLKRQNEQRCLQEIDDIKRGGDSSRFSDEALDEQKHSIRIADEKVSLAVQAYDIVDTHIQQLDQYLKKLDEELRRERESVAASGLPTTSLDSGQKFGRSSEGGRGRRNNRTRQAMAAAASAVAAATEVATVAANPTGMEMDLPVDPNEPTYCICNQVSFGEMVACDNSNCKIEWFHFGCVGLKEQPRGKWYCPECAALRNRRRGR